MCKRVFGVYVRRGRVYVFVSAFVYVLVEPFDGSLGIGGGRAETGG